MALERPVNGIRVLGAKIARATANGDAWANNDDLSQTVATKLKADCRRLKEENAQLRSDSWPCVAKQKRSVPKWILQRSQPLAAVPLAKSQRRSDEAEARVHSRPPDHEVDSTSGHLHVRKH